MRKKSAGQNRIITVKFKLGKNERKGKNEGHISGKRPGVASLKKARVLSEQLRVLFFIDRNSFHQKRTDRELFRNYRTAFSSHTGLQNVFEKPLCMEQLYCLIITFVTD